MLNAIYEFTLSDYGSSQQIYPLILPDTLVDKPYRWAAWEIYKQYNILLIAVEDSVKKRVIVCPMGTTSLNLTSFGTRLCD